MPVPITRTIIAGKRQSTVGRIRIQLPKQFSFHTDLEIRISDINYGNHLGNDAVLRLLHEARVRYLGHHGFTESDICGVGLVISDAAVVYKSQGYHGDPLRIEITTAEPGRYGCNIYYRITNQATGKEVARAKTGLVFFDYARNKLAELPEEFERIIPVENM